MDYIDAGFRADGGGKELRFYGGIVVLPDPRSWREGLDFGARHDGRLPGNEG